MKELSLHVHEQSWVCSRKYSFGFLLYFPAQALLFAMTVIIYFFVFPVVIKRSYRSAEKRVSLKDISLWRLVEAIVNRSNLSNPSLVSKS